MPQLPPYEYTGPVDCSIPPDRTQLRGKSVVVTGGANGMGEATVRALAAEGAFVTIADVNEERGRDLAAELRPNAQFVKCNISSWEEQVQVFEAAISSSPHKSCDIVIANAGISRASGDDLWPLDDPNQPPVKPELRIMDVNMTGTLYTWKLAVHYFRRQPNTADRDRCFIITGSMVAWIDSPANWQYTCSKYGLRGLMRVARRSSWEQGIRINYVAPCYIKSAIRSPEYEAELTKKGVEFAPQEDVAECMMKLATDRTINGHSLMITPKSVAKEGYKDVDMDDHIDEGYFKRTQEVQLKIIGDRWDEGWSKNRTAEGAPRGIDTH
ncbi:short chain dehydrogenase/ reductase [Aspergillus affinis]|uniref:short chain dehydrogenase/ reductase n=1 Tax=Aspergillus affinis TaxID=1070780 RepID=UPI0022FEB3EF|nr:short chain dehydrogenase/ reductase [Aspergillus affinis]KAI9046036.1 short chain dehydrogenase/ reductase [Aspergillus affinis]